MKHLFVLLGPTGVGKSAVSQWLAQQLLALGAYNASDTPEDLAKIALVSADARQLYKEFDVGVAKPPAETVAQLQAQGIVHYFINSHSLAHPLTAGGYEQACLACLKNIFAKQSYAILLGGSSLYVQALCQGLSPLPHVRVAVQEHWRQQSLDTLQAYVQAQDPAYYARIDTQNPRRLMRAAALIETAQKPYSALLTPPKKRPFVVHKIGLQMPKNLLKTTIQKRCQHMLQAGLVQEAQQLFCQFGPQKIPKTIGYQEFFTYFQARCTYEEAQDLFIRNSLRYAKRQSTWLRSQADMQWFDSTAKQQILHYLLKHMQHPQEK